MSILHDETQRAIAAETRRILASRTDKARLLALLDTTGEIDQDFWQTAKVQGWTGIGVPEALGGNGLRLGEMGLVAQEIGAVLAGAPYLTPSYGMVQALLSVSNDEQARHWLPLIASGEATAAVALGDGMSGEPVLHYRDGAISGVEPGVTAGLRADLGLFRAAGPGEDVLVIAELRHVQRRTIFSFDNSRLHADLVFESTPATVLASGPEASRLAHDVLAQMAVVTAHEQVGGAEALMLAGRDYALERKAFGQPIGAFQSVKHRLAELYGLVEIARANAHHAATRLGKPDFMLAAAAARLSATEAYDTAVRDVVQIHGGIGVAWVTGLHLHTRRARSLAIEQGNMLFWEDLLVGLLAGEAE